MQEKDNILRIIREALKAIKNNDSYGLRIISDQTNNTASRTQDPDNITLAVLIYSLSKLIERKKDYDPKQWKKFHDDILLKLKNLDKSLSSNSSKKTQALMKEIRKNISKITGDLNGYIQDVFRKASINKASKIYSHGISMEKTAKLLGITMYEIAGYVGQKKDSEEKEKSDVFQRIKFAKEIFN